MQRQTVDELTDVLVERRKPGVVIQIKRMDKDDAPWLDCAAEFWIDALGYVYRVKPEEPLRSFTNVYRCADGTRFGYPVHHSTLAGAIKAAAPDCIGQAEMVEQIAAPPPAEPDPPLRERWEKSVFTSLKVANEHLRKRP